MLLILVVFILFLPLSAEAEFEQISGLMDSDISFLLLHPFNDEIIYAASGDTLYKKEASNIWKLIYKIKEGNINFVYPDPTEYGLLFIAADSGLLLTRDQERFEYIFRDRNQNVKCFYVKRIGSKIYLGTSEGLYHADMGVYNFQKIQTLSSKIEVYWVDYSKPFLYIATNMGVYESNDLLHFRRTFVASRDEDVFIDVDGEKDSEGEEHRNTPSIIQVGVKDKRKIYMGTNNGLFVSSNQGKSFIKTYLQGLPNTKINFIFQSMPETVYIATDEGLFKAYPSRRTAMKIYEGLPTGKINCISMDNKGKIYLATSRGVFIEGEDSQELIERQYQLLCKDEPSCQEIQEESLAYNEVSPEKIRAWRISLKYRALMPQLKLGYDKTVTTALGASYDKVQIGPRDWSLDLTWDLDNLIWNMYQDDVDTRARLNTQLRIDILNEVNRLYFERLRVKNELLNKTPKNSYEYIKQMMYLEELTAALDAYTGGYYSKCLKKMESNSLQ
ncbi:MAG: hypothetical protein P9M06_01490 [Candidatus Saelkia tenebricola]|nr:hypothetical protein [Candidatus Saelkia tenebricola]